MNTIYILIDPQNDFITGVLGSPEAKEAATRITAYLNEQIHKYGNINIYITKDEHYNNYEYENTIEGKKIPLHCKYTGAFDKGEDGSDIYPSIDKALSKENFRYKHLFTKTSFLSSSLIEKMIEIENTGMPIDEIVIMGFCSDICVISNALALRSALPCTEITFLSNLSAGSTPENHEAAKKIMKANLIRVVE